MFNPFRPTRQKTDVILCRFLESLVLLRSAPNFRRLPHRMSCTLSKKKIWNFFKTFLVIVVLIYLSYFHVKKRFLNSFYDMLWTIFHLFQYWNFTTYCNVRTSGEKNSKKMSLNFFSNSAFSRFFRIFFTYYVISQ
jgi:hypothetical protein